MLELAGAYAPAGHADGADTLTGQALPAGQPEQTDSQRAGPKEPPGHGRHALKARWLSSG